MPLFAVNQRVIRIDPVKSGSSAMPGVIVDVDEFEDGFYVVLLDETRQRWEIREDDLAPETTEAAEAFAAYRSAQEVRLRELMAVAANRPGLMLDEDAIIAAASIEVAAIRARFV
jgi:hypothetical protein